MAQRPVVTTSEDLRLVQPVILGADYSAYAYVRALHKALGVRSIICGSDDIKAISRTRYADYRVIPNLDSAQVLLDTLASLGQELCEQHRVPWLVTCGDFYARLVAEHKAEIEQWFYTPVADLDVMLRVSNKEEFIRICDDLNLARPQTCIIDMSDPNAAVSDEGFRYPLVVKAADSAAYHYAEFEGKCKVFVVQNRAELDRVVTAIRNSSYNKGLLIQEFIPGGDSQMYAVYAYADRSSQPVFMVTAHVGLEDHHPAAVGNAVAMVPEKCSDLEDDVARFMKHVGWHGMCCFDAKRDPRDGRFYLLEMNPRPGRSSWIVLLSGINYAKVQLEDVLLGSAPGFCEPARDWAYVAAPASVLRRYVEDPDVLARIEQARKNRRTSFALDGDHESLPQRFWAWVNFANQARKFRRYLG